MERTANTTRNINNFLLLAFTTTRPIQVLLFIIFLFAYILTLVQNTLVIVIIWTSSRLHKPMYFFLGHLSFLELWYINVTVPKLLLIFLIDSRYISLTGCIFQLYFFLFLGCTECVLLAVMAFDRYVAICHPLRYLTIMTKHLCLLLASGSWVTGFCIAFIKIYYISSLNFCHSGLINHFYCDISPLLNLSCSDMTVVELIDFLLALFIFLTPLLLICFSYVCILITILHISTSIGRKKAFSTCASHLVVVLIFYAAVLFMYARPSRAQSLNFNKLVSVFYTVITPLLNPVIYCLRNKDVKEALLRLVYSKTDHTMVGNN
ncbi:olfactory receptor 6B1-like [Bombina bombina]|uniref:olfactory receptor 6B1-like n=1 Tax=Bombina bombina TaxID=8345 RepID=UPI00235ADFD0|nr:olfactory receptor 6B1-like [Bombina bombina]